jgi:peptidoglycan/LPS O-acetylase OafA/YrhL
MSEHSKRPLTLGDFDFRSNSIGFLRLLFAAIVVWSHTYLLGGFGEDPVARLTGGALNAGFLSVGGFFVLSGLLITRSFERVGSVERFLWHRFLRIFPAFWVCLVVVAFGFAPLAFYYDHGALAGFTSAPYSPWSYLVSNALLQMNQYNIGALLTNVPYPSIFNKSLWTLQYEFLCYLSVAALGLIGALRLKAVVAILFLFLLFVDSMVLWEHGKHVTTEAYGVIGLLVYFAAGSCAYLFRDHIPMRWWVAALCLITLAVGLPTRAYAFVVAPCVSYLTLFAAMKLPLRNFDRRMDFSYGLYIYAFPVQQMLALYGVNADGFVPYFFCALAIALLFAAASWFTIEKPSLSLKNRAFVPRRYSSRV